MDYVQAVHRAVSRLVSQFQSNPFNFLSERDIQAYLFGLLIAEFQGPAIRMTGTRHSAAAYGDNGIIETVPVHCEYPSGLRPFDIAVLDRETIQSYDQLVSARPSPTSDTFWYQPVCIALELKYWQLGAQDDWLRRVQDDVEKLRAYMSGRKEQAFLGLSILFVQSATQDLGDFATGVELGDDPKSGLARYLISRRSWKRFSA